MRATANTVEGQPPGVLVLIEPDGNVSDALKKLLQGFGWVVEASPGRDSLNQLLAEQEVTAVISEASVPGCAAAEILHSCSDQHVPVIFTGHDVSPQAAVDLLQKGALDFLEKPFSHNRLLDLLNQLKKTGTMTA